MLDEGEQATISKPEEHYSVLQCCGAAVGKGKEARGWRRKEKNQMSKLK
jgi:hypothetical protein